MKTTLSLSVSLVIGFLPAVEAQVLIAGGSSPSNPSVNVPAPVPVQQAVLAVPVAYAVPVIYHAPPPCVPVVQVVSGGCYNPPNVIYFGGPNSCYSSTYPGCSSYNPSVIYFGRGEACQRGYAFRHPR